MRDTTERPEGIAAGTLKLVGTDEKIIYNTFKLLLEDKLEYEKMSHASKRIADILEGLGTSVQETGTLEEVAASK